MTLTHVNHGGILISTIGLGCSRLGSMMGSSVQEAETLVAAALDRGITVFDTAASYGQGDSERILGRLLSNLPDICLVTKVGKVVPWKARLLRPVKTLVRTFGRRSGAASKAIRQSRGATLPVCFDPAYLAKQLDKSRMRLKMETLPVVMLHSPAAEVLLQGEAIGFLTRAQESGVLRHIGVSVDDLTAAEAALNDPRITVVQTPLFEGDTAMAEWCARAGALGKLVMAREIFRGFPAKSELVTDHLCRNLRRSLKTDGVGVSLVGTTKTAHLDQILSLYPLDSQ